MPISKAQLALYPRSWKAIRKEILERAGSRCECAGECKLPHAGGRCGLLHGEWVRRGEAEEEMGTYRTIRIVLTIAHLNHNPKDSRRRNLKAMCQRCHLRYDSALHQRNAALTRDRKRGQLRLFQ